MKITKSKLKQIITEPFTVAQTIQVLLREGGVITPKPGHV